MSKMGWAVKLPGAVHLVVEPCGQKWDATMFETSWAGSGAAFDICAETRQMAIDSITGLYRAEMLRRATKPLTDLLEQ